MVTRTGQRGRLARFGVLAGVLALLMLVQVYAGRAAPTPPVFDEGLTLAAAMERAGATERPVFVLATADWCGPCQALKRGAMQDARVTAWLRENTLPVHLDVTDGVPPEAASLGISQIPAMLLLRNGETAAHAVGVMGADELLGWLRQTAPAG